MPLLQGGCGTARCGGLQLAVATHCFACVRGGTDYISWFKPANFCYTMRGGVETCIARARAKQGLVAPPPPTTRPGTTREANILQTGARTTGYPSARAPARPGSCRRLLAAKGVGAWAARTARASQCHTPPPPLAMLRLILCGEVAAVPPGLGVRPPRLGSQVPVAVEP